MLKPLSFKLASRIACLAVMVSAALWLNAPVHADGFSCVISANNNTGYMTKISCGTSAGDVFWTCEPSDGYCTSDPQMDNYASTKCAEAAANGCPEIVYFLD